jgi:quercetin dioxygenase-like cupin family protein
VSIREIAETGFASEGLTPETWSNEAGYSYAEHSHTYHKVLYCIEGGITFHTPSGVIEMRPGDRLDLPPGTPHSASVGPQGVTCMEAPRQ